MLIWLLGVAVFVVLWSGLWRAQPRAGFGVLLGLLLAWIFSRLITPYMTGMKPIPIWLPPLSHRDSSRSRCSCSAWSLGCARIGCRRRRKRRRPRSWSRARRCARRPRPLARRREPPPLRPRAQEYRATSSPCRRSAASRSCASRAAARRRASPWRLGRSPCASATSIPRRKAVRRAALVARGGARLAEHLPACRVRRVEPHRGLGVAHGRGRVAGGEVARRERESQARGVVALREQRFEIRDQILGHGGRR